VAKKRTHKDVEFHVSNPHRNEYYARLWDEAVERAVEDSISTGTSSTVDVLIWSRSGARWWAGDHGVEMYDEDPEASVYERFKINAYSEGRIP
jgi:hypothetical protein